MSADSPDSVLALREAQAIISALRERPYSRRLWRRLKPYLRRFPHLLDELKR